MIKPISVPILNPDRNYQSKFNKFKSRQKSEARKARLNADVVVQRYSKNQTSPSKRGSGSFFDFRNRDAKIIPTSLELRDAVKTTLGRSTRSRYFARFFLRIPEAAPHFKFFCAIFAVFLKKRQNFSAPAPRRRAVRPPLTSRFLDQRRVAKALSYFGAER